MLEVSDSHNLVNGKDFSGRTPIHLAAAAGQYSVLVEFTSVAFVNIEALDNNGRYMHVVEWCYGSIFTSVSGLEKSAIQSSATSKYSFWASNFSLSGQGIRQVVCQLNH